MNRLYYVCANLRRAAENGYSWCVLPDEAVALVAEVERLRAEVAELRALGVSLHKSAAMGRDAERAAVVRWLRGELCVPGLSPDEKRLLSWASRRIERGEHCREEGDRTPPATD